MTASYVDANVLVFAFGDSSHPRRPGARALLEQAADQGPLVTSVLTVDEFLWARRRESGSAVAVADTKALLRAPALHLVAVEKKHAHAAVEHVESDHLHPRDAFHAAVAKASGCTQILSDDPDFDPVDGIRRVGP